MIRMMFRRATGGRWPRVRSDERLSCGEVGRLLQRYLDGELDGAAEVDALAAHLDECEGCGLEADTYRRIKATLEARRTPVSAETVERLRQFGERLAEH